MPFTLFFSRASRIWSAPKSVKSRPGLRLHTCLILLSAASPAIAQDTGRSIKVGEADLYPEVRIDYISKSNAFLTAQDETEASAFEVSPSLSLVANNRSLEFSLDYDGAYAVYGEDVLSYDDHALSLTGIADINSRNRATGTFSVVNAHEALGTNFTRGIAGPETEQIEYTDVSISGGYVYGNQTARGNILAQLLVTTRQYLNQDTLTQGEDRSLLQPTIGFSYRLSPATRAVIDASFGQYDFDNDFLDREDVTIRGGFDLSQDGKLGGTIRVGGTMATYNDARRLSTDELTADINLFYLPLSYSRWELAITRGLDNTEGNAGALVQAVTDSVRLNWRHQWTERVLTRSFVARTGTTRECPDQSVATVAGGIELAVSARQWLEFGAGLSASERSADECNGFVVGGPNLDFEQQSVNVFTRVTL